MPDRIVYRHKELGVRVAKWDSVIEKYSVFTGPQGVQLRCYKTIPPMDKIMTKYGFVRETILAEVNVPGEGAYG